MDNLLREVLLNSINMYWKIVYSYEKKGVLMKNFLCIAFILTFLIMCVSCKKETVQPQNTSSDPHSSIQKEEVLSEAPKQEQASSSETESLVSQIEISEDSSSTEVITPNNNETFVFKNGPNGEQVIDMKVGDTFIGFTLTKAETSDGMDLMADFDGTVTLKGTLSREDIQEGPGGWIEFFVAEVDEDKLPYFELDTRALWFSFINEQDVIDAVGQEFFKIDCEITICNYKIDYRPMMVYNTAEFVDLKID